MRTQEGRAYVPRSKKQEELFPLPTAVVSAECLLVTMTLVVCHALPIQLTCLFPDQRNCPFAQWLGCSTLPEYVHLSSHYSIPQ